MIDTLPKINRKQCLENEMKNIEKEIEMLEQFKNIYVSK